MDQVDRQLRPAVGSGENVVGESEIGDPSNIAVHASPYRLGAARIDRQAERGRCTAEANGSLAPLPPYPHGWFYLANAAELKRGAVLRRRLADEDVVVYRTESGAVCAVRPYCPHLGAHLGVGGSVAGDNLVCPFHGFAFAPDGRCVGSPDGATIRGKVVHYRVAQRLGMVFVWYSDDGSPPTWDLPPVADEETIPTTWWTTDLPAHPQEIAENSADSRHFMPLHRMDVHAEAPCEVTGPFFRINWGSAGKSIFMRLFAGKQSILLAGLGYTLIRFEFPNIGVAAYSHTLTTPTGPWQTRMHFGVAIIRHPLPGGKVVNALVARLILLGVVRVIRQDIPIWSNKKYNPTPSLAPGERNVAEFRSWRHQFYPGSDDTTGRGE
jgi:nitrite reductase/ring-hydroxylating ferredoxin subunit